ncbi:hypothetical protein RBSH_00352 [Rhodopirellula baltica SH28]|uniref:Uncharacterized protein n=2 Tax=Rhodopirellula baltica TaxID=265606 RepID=F2AMC4_RHOBT|nr:hypothetical protein RBWH47_04161 [Rhodopirellula baltica WH47]EKK04320.1 hypothetical protein RBSH_00352 [Rhodopirellula baltica SH28]
MLSIGESKSSFINQSESAEHGRLIKLTKNAALKYFMNFASQNFRELTASL